MTPVSAGIAAPLHSAEAIEQLSKTIESGSRFLISSHVNPDGDSIGSTCALASVLRSIGKEVTVVFEDPVPLQYRFIPGSEQILVRDAAQWVQADHDTVAIILDCSELDRIGQTASRLIRKCGTLAIIDHHATSHERISTASEQPSSAQVGPMLLDSTAAATGELVYYLMRRFVSGIPLDIAISLYVALTTDTGSFRYSNTSPACLRIAAELIEAGAEPGEISEMVFDTKTIEYLRLLSYALSHLETAADGRIAYLVITEDALRTSGAKNDELEGLVNYAKMVDTAVCAVLFSPSSPSEVKVSFRCKRGFRVDQIAAHFGGGGHVCASGARVRGHMDDVVRSVISYISDAIADHRERV